VSPVPEFKQYFAELSSRRPDAPLAVVGKPDLTRRGDQHLGKVIGWLTNPTSGRQQCSNKKPRYDGA
jgi:hypothetical protein